MVTDKEQLIAHYMASLNCTREEAIDVIQEDEIIDKMKDTDVQNDLTEEQKKASKKARQADRKKTVYNFDTSKREKKIDPTKQGLIRDLVEFLAAQGWAEEADIEVTNDQRQIDFKVQDKRYRLVLSAPRK